MDYWLSLAANLIEIGTCLLAITLFVRKTLRDTKFKSTYRPKPKSIFRVAKDNANSVATKIFFGNNEPTLLQLDFKKNTSGHVRSENKKTLYLAV
jgi:hypothetical protein